MRIVIAGGSGLIGRHLTRSLLTDGHTVLWLTRNPHLFGRETVVSLPTTKRTNPSLSESTNSPSPESGALRPGPILIPWLTGNARPIDELKRYVPLDVVVNLSGTTIAGRWTPSYKRRILESRLRATTELLEVMERLPTEVRPRVMDEIGRAVAARLRRPYWLPVPAFAIRLFLGEMGDLLIRGIRVFPKEALARGYAFRFPTLEIALEDLLSP